MSEHEDTGAATGEATSNTETPVEATSSTEPQIETPKVGDTRPVAPQVGDTISAPKIGDTAPSPAAVEPPASPKVGDSAPGPRPVAPMPPPKVGDTRPAAGGTESAPVKSKPQGPPRDPSRAPKPVVATPAAPDATGEVDETTKEGGGSSKRRRRRGGRERKGRTVGRYLMCVHVEGTTTHIAMLEGRSLVEHYVVRETDETTQIDGNLYLGRVQNVLPGMEAAFVDIGIPKNAVLYRGDVHFDADDVEGGIAQAARIEDVLRAGQLIVCQVTKNPIGAKGARLTQEVSLPGRFAVLVPNSSTIGISKRLGDNERKRLRKILDEVRPEGHGLIVRTAAEGASAEDLKRDVAELAARWKSIEAEAAKSGRPGLLFRELDLAVRMLREELNGDYRGVLIDDENLYNQVRSYVGQVSPEMVERVEHYNPTAENLPLFERYFVHEQLHKALDRKVWLPSGGSLIIERTEALTVIDVNTGKNVGKTNLEETVFKNNLEAAEEVAHQLRLRDIGGIIVIDFIDMEAKGHREAVAAQLRQALSRDKTRTQVFDISELGLVEMTRKRISEGLIESVSTPCSHCDGRGITFDPALP
ncbi:MAG: Rne/Rng family ribonuclease [Actinomycetes bacterium]